MTPAAWHYAASADGSGAPFVEGIQSRLMYADMKANMRFELTSDFVMAQLLVRRDAPKFHASVSEPTHRLTHQYW